MTTSTPTQMRAAIAQRLTQQLTSEQLRLTQTSGDSAVWNHAVSTGSYNL